MSLRWASSQFRREAQITERLQIARVVRLPSDSKASTSRAVVEISTARVLAPLDAYSSVKTACSALGSMS